MKPKQTPQSKPPKISVKPEIREYKPKPKES